MPYDISNFSKEVEETREWLAKEYRSIRVGRATISVLDNIKVEIYGSKMPINQVASISVEDPKTLRINPWDSSQIKMIRKAIEVADLGVGVLDDEKGIRISFPDLSSERRAQLLKIAKEKLEEARVAIRTKRDDVWSDIQKKVRDSELSEDEKFKLKDDLQKKIDEANKELESIAKRKEEELAS